MAHKKEKTLIRQGSVSENFFAVNHASLILPKRGSPTEPVKNMKSLQFGGDLKTHLYAIIRIIRPQDQIKLVARLESWVESHIRYLVIVSTMGRQDTEESVILGIDFAEGVKDECTIGFAVPVWNDVTAELDGDGGFELKVPAKHRSFSFKPVSVQAMWSALHTFHHCISIARHNNYFTGSLFLTWTCYYESCIQSSRIFINEWEHEATVFTRRPNYYCIKDKEQEATELKIRGALKQVLMRMDLDNCKSRDVRIELEKTIDLDLKEYKSFIDQEMVVLLRQMDTASEIFDFLYLGSAWNAADEEELKRNGITHILNISVIVDNFFPDDIKYKNIRVYDEAESDLLSLWNDTYKFLKRAIKRGGKCLVHCRMGISRSSSTVIAFVMKEMQWPMEKALNYVREKRPIVSPNPGFMEQLREYEGILKASSQRHNILFRSLSENNLAVEQNSPKKELGKAGQSSILFQGNFDYHRHLLDIATESKRFRLKRSKSWTAGDSKFEDDDIMRTELYGDESTEPYSEPQNLYLKSSENDKQIELVKLDKHSSKRKRKFKRRHTEMAFGWQSSETDVGLRSDESIVANSDCGIPTHRFSWDKSSVASSEESQSLVTHPFSMNYQRNDASGDKKDLQFLRKSTGGSAPCVDAIDEVFEEDGDLINQNDEHVAIHTSVKNLVQDIESKCFTKTHSRQSSNEKDFVQPGIPPSQHTVESQIPIVPEVSIVENKNSNNNILPNTNSSSADNHANVVPLNGDKTSIQRNGCNTLSKDQLRIIREVGKTFIGEIPPTNENLLMKNNPEEYQSQCSNGFVRKGLVRRMARAIESRNKPSEQPEDLQFVQTTSNDVAKEDAGDTTSKTASDNGETSACNVDVTASWSLSLDKDSITSQSQLPHIFSVVAPTPYHQFQKSMKTSRSIRKSISFDAERYKRGVTRSHSERSHASRTQQVIRDSTNLVRNDAPSNTLGYSKPDFMHDNTLSNIDANSDLGSGNVTTGDNERNKDEITENNLNRIDRQNSLYKSI